MNNGIIAGGEYMIKGNDCTLNMVDLRTRGVLFLWVAFFSFFFFFFLMLEMNQWKDKKSILQKRVEEK